MTELVELLVQNIETGAEELRKGRFLSQDRTTQLIEFARIIEDNDGATDAQKQRCNTVREFLSGQVSKK